jgi:hypothetical protein
MEWLRTPSATVEPAEAEEVRSEPELTETPVIGGEQATLEIPELTVAVTQTPGATSQAEPVEPTTPVTCSGCKAIVDLDKTTPCLNPDCPKSLVFCPACAKPNTCHKCGQKLVPDKD